MSCGRCQAPDGLDVETLENVETAWDCAFDSPIELRNGQSLLTLKDAAFWLAHNVSKPGHGTSEIRAATHFVTEAAENGGDIHFARFAMILAIIPQIAAD